MVRTYLWAVAVCLIVISPFAGMAGAHGQGDMANPAAAKDGGEYDIGGELFHEPVFTINGQAVTQQKQGAHSDTTNRTSAVPDRQAQEAYGKLPLYFIQNNGQMDERVKFYEKGAGHAMFFTEDGVCLSLTNRQEARCQMQDARSKKSENRNQKSEIQNLSPNVLIGNHKLETRNSKPETHIPQSAIVKLVPLGANKHPKIVAEGLQQGKVNYFIGNQPEGWRTNIPTYGAVVYKEIYDGIDIKFYGNNRQLEYDVIVRPGADPSQVRFAYEGIEDLRVNEDGDLEIILSRLGEDATYGFASPIRQAQGRLNPSYTLRSLPEWLSSPSIPLQRGTNTYPQQGVCCTDKRGTNTCPPLADAPDCPPLAGVKGVDGTEKKIIQRRPYIYQEIDGKRVEVAGEFRVLSLESGVGKPVVRNQKLEIRNSKDSAQNPKLKTRSTKSKIQNLSPNVLVGDPKLAMVSPQYAIRNPQFIYGFRVASYDTSRPLIIDPVFEYSTYIGGASTDRGYAIAVDGSGSAYVTGLTASSNFPRVGTTTGYATNTDAFVTKLGTETPLALIYSTYIGGSGADYGIGITVDGSGSAYVTGYTTSSNFPRAGTSTAKKTGYDAFVTKLSASGDSLEYSTYIGGSGDDLGQGIAVDSFGSAYISGYTSSSNFPVVGTSTTKKSGDDVFVTRLGTETPLAIIYSTYIGGSGSELGRGIALDGSGFAYVSGYTTSTDFPLVGTTTGHGGGTYDSFVTKLGTETPLALIYSTYVGGNGDDLAIGIAVDVSGSAYISGHTTSANFPVVGTTTGHAGGTYDAFVTKLGTETPLALVYSTYIGGSGNDYCGLEIDVDGSGSAYVSGYTTSANFPVVGTTTGHAAGTEDAFVIKLGTGVPISILYSTYIGGSGSDVALGIAVDGTGSAYIAGYTASSNFPVVGTSTAKKSGDDVFVTKLIFTPWVVTGSADDITVNFATLSGTVSAMGLTTTAMFSYGVTSGLYTGTSSTQSLTGENTAVSIELSGLSASTTYYYRIVANNSAGTSTGSEESFTTSSSGGGGGNEPVKEKLTISSTSPSSNATGVPVTTSVSATFSMYVNGATVTTETFTLSEENGDVSGSVVTNGKTITFIPSLALLYGTKYTATVTTKVFAANWAGTAMESNYTWSFTTENLIDVTPTPAASPTPAATPVTTVTPVTTPAVSPTATATYTPVPTLMPTLPPVPTPLPTFTPLPPLPTLPPKPTPPPVPTPVVSIAPTLVATPTPAECTADSMSLSAYNLSLKMKKSKEVIVTVTGIDGCMVEGDAAKTTVDKKHRKYVAVSPRRATTDANGQARFKIKARGKKGNAEVVFVCEEMEETVRVRVAE